MGNVYVLAHAQYDREKTSWRGASVSEPAALSFWPGGGGAVDSEMLPANTYHIVGTFNNWGVSLPMEREGDGVYGFTLTLGESRIEHFQIWLDGDGTKVLHPPWGEAGMEAPVLGPSEDAAGVAWSINGRGQVEWIPQEQAAADDVILERSQDMAQKPWVLIERSADVPHVAKAGDSYRVRLQTRGKWRGVQ